MSLTTEQREAELQQGLSAELFNIHIGNDYLHYTSFPRDLSLDYSYTSIPITRSAFTIGYSVKGMDCNVRAPASLFSQFLIYNDVPPADIIIKRVFFEDINTYKQIFKGQLRGISVDRGEISMKFACFVEELEREICRVQVHSACNNQLFDSVCGLDSDDYKCTGTVASIVNGAASYIIALTGVTPNNAATQAVGYFALGKCKKDTSSYNYRMTTKSTYATGVWTLNIHRPIQDLQVGDTLELWPGCTKIPGIVDEYLNNILTMGSLTIGVGGNTCKDTFDNIENYVGMPYVPNKNLSISPLTLT